MRFLRAAVTALSFAWAAGIGVGEPAAHADLRLSVKLEPAVGFPVAGPQRQAFGVGGGGFGKFAYGPLDWLDLQLSVGGLAFAPKGGGSVPGIIGAGGGLRLQLPQKSFRVSPFADVDLLYARTGEFDRFGYAVGAGVLFAVNASRSVWLGVHLRYLQIVQDDELGFDSTDASIIMAGISTQFGSKRRHDMDGDGVVDEIDRCPKIPGPASNNGCPTIDSDGDGLNDSEDGCPLVVGPKENQGCPWPDRDKDGVLDKVDRCPTEAGPAQNEGCPWGDTDGDGLSDPEDRCPKVPGLRQFGGCPDHDGDGVPEPPDLCPDKPGPVDNNGCPRYRNIVVRRKQVELNQKIFFAFDRAEILSKSFGLLNEVAEAFKDYPGLRVRIEGHTDAKGSSAHNMKLSQARAESVMKYLVDHGVAADRLTAHGFGPTQPLDTNGTAEGRERNRRVEFVVEAIGEGQTADEKATDDDAAAPAKR